VAGFHLHFLRLDKQEGGHAYDYRLREGRVRIAALHGFQVELPASGEFLKANLGDAELDKKIKPSEGYLFLNNAGESRVVLIDAKGKRRLNIPSTDGDPVVQRSDDKGKPFR